MPSPAHSILDHQQPNIDRHLNKHHLAGEVDMYSGNDFSLDPALTEISIQVGDYDDVCASSPRVCAGSPQLEPAHFQHFENFLKVFEHSFET